MIYVLTGHYSQFQNFAHEFGLRENFGPAKRGHVRYLSDMHRLMGLDRGIVLTWGTWFERQDRAEIEDYCKARDIPFLVVPDLRRIRHFSKQGKEN